MLMLLVILGTLGMIALLVRWLREDNICPLCGSETVEVGYSGYKRKCLHCKWDSTDSEMPNDDFLDKP